MRPLTGTGDRGSLVGRRMFPFLWLLAFTSCKSSAVPSSDALEALPAGSASTSVTPFPSSELPASNLPQSDRPEFHAGKALAHQPWVKAPSTTDARDGLGPLYNARTCLDCHHKGGRGRIPDDAERVLVSSFLRLSIPGSDLRWGAVPEPTYGLQLQTQSTALSHQLRARAVGRLKTILPPEAQVRILWEKQEYRYPDGQRITLRKPTVQLDELAYGALHPDARLSLRVAPPIHGAGLIELIDESQLNALEDPEDKNQDGISGRSNLVWNFRTDRPAKGRFGYKASRATLEITVAAAFAGDMGITSSLFPNQPCTDAQTACHQQPSGASPGGVELSDPLLALVVDFNRNLGVPQRRGVKDDAVQTGRRHFYEAGCAECHHPKFKTSPSASHPHLGDQIIWPYSDFLLHDMGPELSDNRSDYAATGQEWRTTPLWGLGWSAQISGTESYLHDGRARNLEEAILWHGGESQSAKRRFSNLAQKERTLLLAFLASL